MTIFTLLAIGVLTGSTTVLFGFGGGFVTVPVILWVDSAAGPAAATVAVATSSVVMVVNAAVATVATPREVLARLRSSRQLLVLLAVGGLAGALTATFAPHAVITLGFVAYLVATIVDIVARPCFLRATAPEPSPGDGGFAITASLGFPIGAIASFLGVGGSVMTMPLLRRSGLSMQTSASLANPLTLAISVPACAAFLAAEHVDASGGGLLVIGSVDVGAAAILLAGAIPAVVVLRRRPPRIPDKAHAWGYLLLLVTALGAMLAQTV